VKPRVIGLDLSLTCTGVAVITAGQVHVQRATSTGRADATLAERGERLRELSRRIVGVRHTMLTVPDLWVIEGPSLGQTRQGGQHDRAGLWWLVVATLQGIGHRVAEVSPAQRAKYATGKGNASKDTVLAAAIRRYPMADIAGNDTADAVILAAMGAHHLGHPLAPVPALHATALEKVRWPQPSTVEEK
jgi:crossover junction endodeoxyribonuclease RuvC